MTEALIAGVHWVSGAVVLAEALNKLERTNPFNKLLLGRRKAAEWLKALAWSLLALGGAGAIVTPWMPWEKVTLQDACLALGFAVLIVRTRVKEG